MPWTRWMLAPAISSAYLPPGSLAGPMSCSHCELIREKLSIGFLRANSSARTSCGEYCGLFGTVPHAESRQGERGYYRVPVHRALRHQSHTFARELIDDGQDPEGAPSVSLSPNKNPKGRPKSNSERSQPVFMELQSWHRETKTPKTVGVRS